MTTPDPCLHFADLDGDRVQFHPRADGMPGVQVSTERMVQIDIPERECAVLAEVQTCVYLSQDQCHQLLSYLKDQL